ncbi:MAG: PEP-CTERM sorting domain-containing protein [Fimbriimonadaceae bacterium]|nr:MAG: PEP-CTERM sorting domain-containing protein [Fimbriimonadaceae bacterium]
MKFAHCIATPMVLVGIGLASVASAQSLFSFASTSVGNEWEFGFNSGNIALNSSISTSGNPVTSNSNKSFSGLDSNGQQQTMTLNSSAFATAQYGILKSSAQATINNPFFDSGNPWYWNPETSEVNENGVPDYFLVAGTSSYSDVFTYTGLGAGFTVNFFYHVDGIMQGDTAYNVLRVTNNGITENFDVEPGANGVVSQTFVTQRYTPNANSQIIHSTSLTSGVSARVYEMDEGVNIVGNSNFANTVSLVGMVAYDAQGNIASGWSFSAGSGATYPVPEPASMSLLALGAVAALRRKKK